ncbi:MAG: hypothetical protein ABS36_08285 [Acidobacteria bacterium SCN 69-37]|nr:MAG: hypothetical protein ABS36_08285 [Acidobacteria bacterium SCN 69-37]
MWAALVPVVPVLMVLLAACVAFALEQRRQPVDDSAMTAVPAVGLVAAIAASMVIWSRGPDAIGTIEADTYAAFFNVACCALGLFTIASTSAAQRRAGGVRGDLLLASIAAMMVAVAARDLLIGVLALQVVWFAGLVMIALGRDPDAAGETAFKTVLVGAFAGAIWWYGVALVRAVAGTTRLDDLAARLAASSLDPHVLLAIGVMCVVAGFAFVVAAVPFNVWAVDVAGGTDAPAAGFVTTGLRLAGCATFLRVLLTAFEPLRTDWLPVVSVIAGVTMVVGAIVAISQPNVRRLLGHIGVAHTGYFLAGLLAASQTGKIAVLFALVGWAAASAVAFAVLALIAAERRHDDVRDFAGLAYDRPALAALLAVCLVSLAGLPPTAGFVGRWLIVSAAIQEGLVSVAVLIGLTSVVLAIACLRLIVQMYMTTRHGPRRRVPAGGGRAVAVAVVVALIVAVGVWPGGMLTAAARSIAAVF